MKKMISLILAVALIAALAISASATVVVHQQDGDDAIKEIEHGLNWCAILRLAPGFDAFYSAEWQPRTNDYVKFVTVPENTTLTRTGCDVAMTVAEGKAICEDNEDINNLTVFRQRAVASDGGAMTIRLWPCDPANKANQSVIVLYRPAGGEWTVLGNQFGDRDITIDLPAGSGDLAVCLGW